MKRFPSNCQVGSANLTVQPVWQRGMDNWNWLLRRVWAIEFYSNWLSTISGWMEGSWRNISDIKGHVSYSFALWAYTTLPAPPPPPTLLHWHFYSHRHWKLCGTLEVPDSNIGPQNDSVPIPSTSFSIQSSHTAALMKKRFIVTKTAKFSVEVQLRHSWPRLWLVVRSQLQTRGALPSGEVEPFNRWIGGWDGLIGGLHDTEKWNIYSSVLLQNTFVAVGWLTYWNSAFCLPTLFSYVSHMSLIINSNF
jgi:hypothetical protein